ncbi:MAG: hypothetical protein ACRBN8_15065 [Nannocystales bacterium]
MVLVFSGCDEDAEGSTAQAAGEADGQDQPPSAEADCEGDGACAGDELCDVYECGGRPARYNHFGCPRVSCDSDEDCPSGEACFSLAFDRTCEPSSTVCTEAGNTCECESTADCEGVLDAHCLPTEFYPPSDYCNPAVWACDELGAWQDALLRAAQEYVGTPLSEALTECAGQAADARETCS